MLINVNYKHNHFLRNSSDVVSINAYDWLIDLMFRLYSCGEYAYVETLSANANASYQVNHADMMY